MSGAQLILAFPPRPGGAIEAARAIAAAMSDEMSEERVARLGWDPRSAFGIDPQDYEDPDLPWLRPEDLGVQRSEDHGYGLRGEPVRIDRDGGLLPLAEQMIAEPAFSGIALLWRWRTGQRRLFPDSGWGDPAYFQWNVWREDPTSTGIELMIDFPQSWIPRTAPFGDWFVGFVASSLRALGVGACAEPLRRSGLYATLDVPALVASLRDGTAFQREHGRFVAITRELVAPAELRASERRARDSGFDVKTRLIERAGILAMIPGRIG